MPAPRFDNCRSCGAPVIWLPSRAGNPVIVDRDSVTDADTLEGRNVDYKPALGHCSHWATCPDAQRWREGKLSRRNS